MDPAVTQTAHPLTAIALRKQFQVSLQQLTGALLHRARASTST